VPDRPTTQEREEIRRLRKENFELRRANEILRSASVFSYLRDRSAAMKFRLIEGEKAEHRRISRLCTVLGVTRRGFYALRRRRPSLRQLGDDELARLIV
jgi:hypothetical protein